MKKYVCILMAFISFMVFIPCTICHAHDCDAEHDYAQAGHEHGHCAHANHCACYKVVMTSGEAPAPALHAVKFKCIQSFNLITTLFAESIFHPPRAL